MKPIRQAKVSSFLRNEIASLIQLELRDPRIGFVSVTRVEPTEDLKEAKVFVSILGNDTERRTALRGLNAAKGFLQEQLAGRHQWRNNPVLRFELDLSIEKQFELEKLLKRARSDETEHAEAEEEDSEAGQREPGSEKL